MKKLLKIADHVLSRVARLFIKIYRYGVSPTLTPRCRFYPTCSAYAEIALQKHGIGRGGLLIIKRLLRCHPFCSGGLDEVPDTNNVTEKFNN